MHLLDNCFAAKMYASNHSSYLEIKHWHPCFSLLFVSSLFFSEFSANLTALQLGALGSNAASLGDYSGFGEYRL